MWQAMLMSTDLPQTKQILIHGFITSGGQKMSKSLGNVVDPVSIVEEYGTDALRYFLLRHIHPTEDSDFTMEKFKEAYNADLANGLGNLVSRVMTMAGQYLSGPDKTSLDSFSNYGNGNSFVEEVSQHLEAFEIDKAADIIWRKIGELDLYIQNRKPFMVYKTDPRAAEAIIKELIGEVAKISFVLEPFMPETSDKIKQAIIENKKPENLFPRKE